MSTPVIAQVHGWCLAGGSELANACDLIYVAEDAKIGYPPVRLMSPPDMQWQTWMMGLRRGMEALLTGDHMTGIEAVQSGMANRAFPKKKLDAEVLKIAERITKIPLDRIIKICSSSNGSSRYTQWDRVNCRYSNAGFSTIFKEYMENPRVSRSKETLAKRSTFNDCREANKANLTNRYNSAEAFVLYKVD